MSQGQVKGFRQAKQPNKKEVMNLNQALQKDMQNLRQNMQLLLQFTQRNMGEVNRLGNQVVNLESLIGYRSSTKMAQEDDVVVLNCIGYDPESGLPFDGGRLDRTVIRIGSKQLIPEFEQQLVGMAAGEDVRTISVKFPEDYNNKDLAGQTKNFDIQVLEVYTQAIDTSTFEARAKELEDKLAAKNAEEAKANEQKSEEKAVESPQA